MKEISKKFFLFMVMAFVAVAITSCDKDPEPEPEPDWATAVSGTYIGKLTSGGWIIEDVYVINVNRISSTAVTVYADFFSNGSAKFNVAKNGSMYTLTSATETEITITIQGNTLSVSFLNAAGTMTSFQGAKE